MRVRNYLASVLPGLADFPIRWDRLNAARVILIAVAFLALVLSYRML